MSVVRPSVRLSVTHRYCVETVQHIIRLFFTVSSHTILVFSSTNVMAIHISTRRRWMQGDMKKSRFLPISRFISETIQDTANMRIRNHTQTFEWYDFQWPWTTPKPYFKATPLFDAEYIINGTIYRHSYNGILHALLEGVISNDL